MIPTEKTYSIKKTARAAGFLYLLVALFGGFSIIFVSSTLIVPGDAIKTVNNIMASELLFRFGFVGGLITQTLQILLVLVFPRIVLKILSASEGLLLLNSKIPFFSN